MLLACFPFLCSPFPKNRPSSVEQRTPRRSVVFSSPFGSFKFNRYRCLKNSFRVPLFVFSHEVLRRRPNPAMLDAMESRITFEVPSSLDFDKLIRDNNYTLFWQNLHGEPSRDLGSERLSVPGDRNSSDFSLMSSLQHFAGARGGVDGWGLSFGAASGGGGSQVEGPLVDPSLLWIGAVMVLLILSGLFCVCSCYLYYKYRRWQKCGECYQ